MGMEIVKVVSYIPENWYIFPDLSLDGHIQMKKKLYVPRVVDKNSHMRMLNISSVGDMIANSMDILEPAALDADGNEREDGNCLLIKTMSLLTAVLPPCFLLFIM